MRDQLKLVQGTVEYCNCEMFLLNNKYVEKILVKKKHEKKNYMVMKKI